MSNSERYFSYLKTPSREDNKISLFGFTIFSMLIVIAVYFYCLLYDKNRYVEVLLILNTGLILTSFLVDFFIVLKTKKDESYLYLSNICGAVSLYITICISIYLTAGINLKSVMYYLIGFHIISLITSLFLIFFLRYHLYVSSKKISTRNYNYKLSGTIALFSCLFVAPFLKNILPRECIPFLILLMSPVFLVRLIGIHQFIVYRRIASKN